MSATRRCEQCGALLPPRAPGGLCPKCLLAQALHSPASPGGSAVGQPVDSLAPRPPPLALPPHFGDYELLEKVAEGGMGVVYRARQLSLNRIVAVKMIQPGRVGSPEMVLRFRAEAEAAASLHHPNIVPIHETGECEGQHYFSMDYIEGQNLAEAVREGPLPSARAAQLVAKIAAAVHCAHQHGILHRDLKPSNVILDGAGEPQVTDFGLARRLGGDSTLTLSGQVFGSPRFMPPEQASGRRGAVGVHSDVYGLGAILYYLLTARPLFVGETMETTLAQVLEQEPVSPRLLNASVARDLETICLKCLEKEPSRRYATAQAVAEELGRFLRGEPTLASPVSRPEKAWRWCRRQPVRAGLMAALILVFVLGVSGVIWQWQRADRNAQEEARQRLRAEANEYAADMKLAQHALMDNDVGFALSLLNKHRPGSGIPASAGAAHMTASEQPDRLKARLRTDLRHWEWRYLWQLCQGDELFTLHRYPDAVRAVAVSRNGKLLALGAGGEVALWDLTIKRPLTVLPIDAGKGLAFSPSGSLLALASRGADRGPNVELWDASAGELVGTLTHHFPVRSLAFSPDGTLLATFDDKGNIALVEWASKKTITNYTAPPPRRDGAGVVVFSPDGSRLAIGEDYGVIRILNWQTGTVVLVETQTSEGVTALAFSPTDELLAAGFSLTTRTIRLWDSHSGQPRGQLTNHTEWIHALAFTPDGRRLASAGADRTIRVWSITDQTELRCMSGYHTAVNALVFLPDGRTLVIGGKDGSVCFWDTTATSRAFDHSKLALSYGFEARPEVTIHGFAPGTLNPKAVDRFGIAFTPDSRSFITTDRDGCVGLWDAQSVQQTKPLPALGSNNWSVALSPDGRWLAVGDATGKVNFWDWQARRLDHSREIQFEWYGWLRFSPSGRFLLATVGSNDNKRTFKMWRTNGWQEVLFSEPQARAMGSAALSPDDRLLATGHGNGAVKLWDFPTGEHETTLAKHKGPVSEVLFSPDGRTLVSTSMDGQVKLSDVFARRELATLRGHLDWAWSAAFLSDGRRLATGATYAKDAVKVWDPATQRELLTLPAEGQFFLQLSFSPDGNILVATSLDGVANFWRAPSWEEIEAAENGSVSP